MARVRAVSVLDVKPMTVSSPDGFSHVVTWQVEGTIEHWGHIHSRVNEYAAELQVTRSDGAWKLSAMNVHRQSQVKVMTIPRAL